MWDEHASAAFARRHQRQAMLRRRQNSQRADLFHVARTLILDHGLALPLGHFAVKAGLTRHAAAALFNTTLDLAAALVRHAWGALIEATAPTDTTTPAEFVAALISAIRADAPAHRIHQALACGTPAGQRAALDDAHRFLAQAVAYGLRQTGATVADDDAIAIGHRVLALCVDAALAPDAPDAGAEAAMIVAMFAAAQAHPAPAPAVQAPASARQRPPIRQLVRIRAAVARPAPILSVPTSPRAHDPPACRGG